MFVYTPPTDPTFFSVVTPTTMQRDFVIAAHTQISAPEVITVGNGLNILIGNDAVLVVGR